MALSGKGRLIKAEKSRTLLYISARVASDSAFPFSAGEELVVTIDKDNSRLIVERGVALGTTRATRNAAAKRPRKHSAER